MVLTNPRIIVGEVAGIPDQLGRGSSTQQFVTHQIPTACAVRAPSTAQQVEQLLAKVDDWGFNIFDLEQATKVLALCCLWLACCEVVCCAAGGKLEHMLCRNCAQLGGGKTASSVLLVTAPQGHALSVLGFHVISRLGLVNELELDGWVLARCGEALQHMSLYPTWCAVSCIHLQMWLPCQKNAVRRAYPLLEHCLQILAQRRAGAQAQRLP
jgi:hypothetical protein